MSPSSKATHATGWARAAIHALTSVVLPKPAGAEMSVNLRGTLFGCQVFGAYFAEQNYGRIVNMASLAGKEGTPNASAYSASKAGVIGLTRTLALELARYKITVNCVAPGGTETQSSGSTIATRGTMRSERRLFLNAGS